ncbi:MAG: FadR family transcriptional regulator [Proteobacteria bacterium]|nr:FadR family transcriptional regulator [Pseudomonadota bacterium]MBU2226785.1 FadR family transcriptional regulator [Pseudomonadota bacterium]MBU2262397.1 FadR family transcriptional regulator [Pseudomonadota bacterium]
MNNETMLKVVEKKRAYEDIVQQVLALIEEGKLKRGDQLPSERELTDIFKVSRTTVREAIRTLESMKLLQCRQGNGTYVLASSEEALIQPLAAALFNKKDDIRDIFFIRRIIEPHVAQLAAENATSQEIEEMERILQEQKQCIRDGKNIIETDSAFHSLMVKATKNHVMERLVIALIDLLRQSREQYLTEGENDKRANRSLDGHRRVLSAVKNGDGDDARNSMMKHLEEIESIIFHR